MRCSECEAEVVIGEPHVCQFPEGYWQAKAAGYVADLEKIRRRVTYLEGRLETNRVEMQTWKRAYQLLVESPRKFTALRIGRER